MNEDSGQWDEMRSRIIGLGEQSSHKSYYPELQRKIEQLEEAREKIRISEENLRAVINGIHDAIIIHTYEGEILDVNESFHTLYGISVDSSKKYTIKDISAPGNDESAVAGYWERVRNGESVIFEWRALKPLTQESLDVEVALRPLVWYGVNVIIGEVRDISDRKRLEQMFRQSQKMEAIGQLAGGFAHDFNNLLGGIIGYAELLTLTVRDNPTVSEYAGIIMDTATQAAEMSKRLLDFSRKGVAKKSSVKVAEIIKKTISLLERSLDRKITIECDCDGEERLLYCDISQMQNAFLNVCINARDAMPNGGAIRIKVRDVELNSNAVFGALRLRAGRYVEIVISDTGKGMPKEIMERIFEPFFTTKEAGKGTGLGLTAVYGCVRDHNGAVTVESTEGEGTSFRFIFPRYMESADSESRDETDIIRMGNGEKILVVDDEEIMRSVARDMLGRLGYAAETAADGIEALDKYRNQPYDLVILDVIMPNMSGAETLVALRSINKDVKAIFCSGNAEGTLDPAYENLGVPYVQKPYSIGTLSERVHRVLMG